MHAHYPNPFWDGLLDLHDQLSGFVRSVRFVDASFPPLVDLGSLDHEAWIYLDHIRLEPFIAEDLLESLEVAVIV